MGYSKYKEDIDRTWAANIFGTRLDFQAVPPVQHHQCPFCSFETTAKVLLETHLLQAHRDAAIFLEHDDRIVPDRVAFRVRPVHLKVRCPALPNGISVSVTSKLKTGGPKNFKDGKLITVTPPDEEVVLVMLGIGVFKREYAISFKKRIFQARLTAHLIEHVNEANTGIGTWAWSDVSRFESALGKELGLSGDEERHRLGIYEYYLGLWLEQNQKPEYVRHLEKAFEVLRDYDEPLALLISSYFLYRVNAFESISPRLPFPRLRHVANFFATSPLIVLEELQAGEDETEGEFVPCEIAIADADAALLDSVRDLLHGEFERAQQHCDTAQQRITAGDDQAQNRLDFVRFRINRQSKRAPEARHFAERTARCNVELFRNEAISFLKTL